MATRELELLETVELKFALARTDEQLFSLVGVFLVPILGKLNDPSPIKEKAISILSHINKRIKGKGHALPLEAIMDVYTQASAEARTANSLMANFALIYLQMGFDRIDSPSVSLFLPRVIAGLSKKPAGQSKILVDILLRILASGSLNGIALATADVQSPEELTFLFGLFEKLLMLPFNPDFTSGKFTSVPGLSTQDLSLITNDGKAPWLLAADALRQLKENVLRFVEGDPSQNIVSTEIPHLTLHRFMLALVASCDPRYPSVASLGDDQLKRLKAPNWENPQLINALFRLFLGSKGQQPAVINPASPDFRPGVAIALKLKILNYASKSVTAARTFPATLQIIFEALFGATNARLRQKGMSFVHWVFRMAPAELLEPAMPVLLSGMLKVIRPPPATSGDSVPVSDETLRGYAYVAIGLLGQKVPRLIRSDLALLGTLFDALRHEPPNVKISVQEGIIGLASGMVSIREWGTDSDIHTIVELINSNCIEENAANRFCALKYAQTVFTRSDPYSRLICLQLANDSKPEVRELALQGLNLELDDAAAVDQVPDFGAMIRVVADYLDLPAISAVPEPLVDHTALVSQDLPVRANGSAVTASMLQYIRRLFLIRAGLLSCPSSTPPSAALRAQLNTLSNDEQIEDLAFRGLLVDQLRINWSRVAIEKDTVAPVISYAALASYMALLCNPLKSGQRDEVDPTVDVAVQFILEFAILSPAAAICLLVPHTAQLSSFLYHRSPHTRLAVSRLLALLLVNAKGGAEVRDLGKQLISQALASPDTLPSDQLHGLTLFMGHFLGRLSTQRLVPGNAPAPVDVDADQAKQYLSTLINKLMDDSTPSLLVSAALYALGEIARYFSLPLQLGLVSIDSTDSLFAQAPLADSFSQVVSRIDTLIAKSQDPKRIELGIRSLANIALGLPDQAETVAAFLRKTPQLYSKQPELHFAIGEAWVYLTVGWDSALLDPHRDIGVLQSNSGYSIDSTAAYPIESLIETLMTSMVPTGSLAARKSAAIWALTLVRFGTTSPTLKAHLPDLHTAFSRLFADKDELIQEVAAKGVGLIFDQGDSETKEDLVRLLMAFFREGKPPNTMRVTGDTEIFDDRQLGTAPDGSTVTTYQSILSLASDMNKPELVYQLMNLANHHAVWNSRRGAAFGFAAILSQSQSYLAPYLPTLIPLLFRYLYDPSPAVNQAMGSIWRALVPEPRQAVDTYFEPILNDLLREMGNRQWRVREASCLAVADLLGTKTRLESRDLAPFLEPLWRMAFRALDDVKESVREAGLKTCRTLGAITVQLCDATISSTARAQPVLQIVVPFLLDKGLSSDAEPVRNFSLKTVLELCKHAGPLLQADLSRIIPALLEALTAFEPQAVNYLSFHTESYNVTADQLDQVRLQAARNSPLTEAIELCLDQVQADTMVDLVPQLQHLVRKGTGLSTRAGVARTLVSLCLKKPHLLREPEPNSPYAASLVKAVSGHLLDPSSATLRKAWSVAIGYLAGFLTKDITLVRLTEHLRKIYLDHMASDLRVTAPVTFKELSMHATERLASIAAAVLPLVYLGLRDRDESVQKVWQDVWTNMNGDSCMQLLEKIL
ncbi:proteasome stabiliser-domain-containing protein [Dimargaris cristalligena]|uniref:Proteasome stabiliser-domain-containing protein n=1 Tax=Dimargaris cristalligena TaxID=215637 RepID=A0A4P9ZVK9_9FUNG|nr:proteasome stabiliser-domain-containing protein [Dimargaris cristalligena]|eukprot:RKP36670.1 proteasome stabiliser-domain-containing protein [Dimargaris cristalligena]